MSSDLITDRPGWAWCNNTTARRGMAFLAMLAVGLACRGNHLGDWDSWDYASQAVAGHSSDLCLGRWWFIALMRAVYLPCHLIWDLTPLSAHIPMQIACAVMTAAAVPLLMAWTRRLTGSGRAELFAGLLIIAAPLVGVYSASVMTESMACLALVAAMYAWQRAVDHRTESEMPQTGILQTGDSGSISPPSGLPIRTWFWAAAAGMAFGIAIDVREPLIMLGLWPLASLFVYKPLKPVCLILLAAAVAALTLGAAVLAAWAWYPWDTGFFGNLGGWSNYMAERRARIGLSIMENIGHIREYAYVSAPAVAVLAIPAVLWSAFRARRMLVLAAAIVPFVLWLLLNHDLPRQPRYLLPLMWVLCPIVAAMLARLAEIHRSRRDILTGSLAAGIVIFGLALAIFRAEFYYSYYYIHVETRGRLCRDLMELPDGAVVIAGQGLPVTYYLNRMGVARLKPLDLGANLNNPSPQNALNAVLAEGKTVYATLRPEDWIGNTEPGGQLEHLTAIAQRCNLERAAGSFVRMKLPAIPPATTQTGD
ncbi:MAG: hypothetical protein HZA50_09105 [Planctomycetes bacterium]|nr:hypothetical protein [Planctomycetota bacterium]